MLTQHNNNHTTVLSKLLLNLPIHWHVK